MATIDSSGTITYDYIDSGAAINIDGELITKSGWNVYNFNFVSDDYNNVSFTGALKPDGTIDESNDKYQVLAQSFSIPTDSNFRYVDVLKTGITAVTSALCAFVLYDENENVIENSAFPNKINIDLANFPTAAKFNCCIASGSGGTVRFTMGGTFGVEILITGTKGENWQDDISFSISKSSVTDYSAYFINFNESDPTTINYSAGATYYYGANNYDEFLIKAPDENVDGTDILVTNPITVTYGMKITLGNFKTGQYVPSIVALDSNGSPIIKESFWLGNNNTYTVPKDVSSIIIQSRNNFRRTSITATMPEAILVATYGPNQTFRRAYLTSNSIREQYIEKAADRVNSGEVAYARTANATGSMSGAFDLEDLVETMSGVYRTNFIIGDGIRTVKVAVQDGGSVTATLKTEKKSGIVGYAERDSSNLPNTAGIVDSVIYTIYYNRMQKLNNQINNLKNKINELNGDN